MPVSKRSAKKILTRQAQEAMKSSTASQQVTNMTIDRSHQATDGNATRTSNLSKTSSNQFAGTVSGGIPKTTRADRLSRRHDEASLMLRHPSAEAAVKRLDKETKELIRQRLSVDYREGQKMLTTLAAQVVPPEALTMIMSALIKSLSHVFELYRHRPFAAARELVLGRSRSAQELEPIFVQSLLKMAIVRIFASQWRKAEIVQLVTTAPHSTHDLEIVWDARAQCKPGNGYSVVLHALPGTVDGFYHPGQLVRARQALRTLANDPELASRLPRIHRITLALNFNVSICTTHLNTAHWFSTYCWQSHQYNYRGDAAPDQMVLDMVKALHQISPFAATVLKLNTTKTWGARPWGVVDKSVEVDCKPDIDDALDDVFRFGV